MRDTKSLCILGSTGSIGQHTLEVVRRHPRHFKVKALAARSNVELLTAQIQEFSPQAVAVYDEKAAMELIAKFPDVHIVAGMEGLEEVSSLQNIDLCVSAMSGSIGIRPTLKAIHAGIDIAIANKEVLVAAGELVTTAAKNRDVRLLPIDSEHSAIFQCLESKRLEEVDRLVLTASGGPFFKRSDLTSITVAEALTHPTWKMGMKNTIDSSTLMNKGLEVIEAYWLFNLPLDKIDVVIHPQSLVHSFVEFVDGSLLAQIAENQMIVPIQYALSYPYRLPRMVKRFDFKKFSQFEFFEPDTSRFGCLRLAYEALLEGGSMPCFMNAANEILVQRFIQGQFAWVDIAPKLEKLMASHRRCQQIDLEDILAIDTIAREQAKFA